MSAPPDQVLFAPLLEARSGRGLSHASAPVRMRRNGQSRVKAAIRPGERRDSGPGRVQVTVVDSDPLTRAGIRAILGGHRGLRLADELDDIDAAAKTIGRSHAPVLVVEAGMAAENQGAAIRAIVSTVPDVKIIAFGLGTREEELFQVFDAGGAGYLIRDTLESDLIPAIQRIVAGKRHVPPEVQRRLCEREQRPALTSRERQVLALLAEGRSNACIAALLDISVGTGKLHVRSILAKLGAEDRLEAAIIARKRGFVLGW